MGLCFALTTGIAHAQRDHQRDRGHDRERGGDGNRIEESIIATARSLDGAGNHERRADIGMVATPYSRIVAASYVDGISLPVAGPNARYVSNRIFSDLSQNLFSQNGVTQWGAAWGQFIDHTIGLRDTAAGESAPIAFDPHDPMERFENDLGMIAFNRTPAAPGTGVTSAREQLNVVSAYIDGWALYGGTEQRLEWMRVGPVDGDLSNNSALMLTTDDNFLPRATERGDVSSAPAMELVGALRVAPHERVITGDIRANENIALTAIHTLFVREHNRIVEALPTPLSEEVKFQIARRLIGAMQQYITYEEFLPAMGVRLPRYRGFNRRVNPSVSNEFAVVGYRAHSMVHGEIEVEAGIEAFSDEALSALATEGVEIHTEGEVLELAVPLNVAYANPNLVELIGVGHILAGLAGESQYKNDEQIDDQLRSVLFQIPRPGAIQPEDCLDGETMNECFSSVMDLGAIDIERARDHGIALYNDLRQAYGLSPITTFTELTGEETDEFPEGIDIDSLDSLTFERLFDIDGNPIALDSDLAEGDAVRGVRHSTLAARLKAIYGSVDSVDAFVGMVSEPHMPGSDLGELQNAIWRTQFRNLRDGDRYFYANDRMLNRIARRYGISYKRRLAEVIADNTSVEVSDLPANVFKPD